ncbi:raffinose/stachyose/melibiose transport system substrate-binding protein [Paenibacillus endophyticus]|uniref:Raffinose/stachyose/melibiose transport system substrate-binding protein n=1 Tax=Paenibacillus endophyticus TaxID=1294268 RepID=A0A7W5C7S4_9BACL|nr:extracellular solute-binding protein [Paenibacillus endophyticus]MBB3152717.1 raffinose/stachyose/melibiose transport system substrate-binding protein [Paenibacillus endophyticus]
MKRFMSWGWLLLYALVLSGAVYAAAIGSDNRAEDVPTEKITLTFRHFWNKEHDRPMLHIFEDAVRSYEQAYPNVKVNMESMDQTIHREQKLKNEMVTGTPPDLFVLFGGAEIEPYIRADRLMDMTAFMEQNDLTNQFQDLHLWSKDNRVYGLPIEGNAEPLFYNKTIFNRLALKVPETIAELTHAIGVLKKNGYTPFALGNEDRWPAAIYLQYLMDRHTGPALIEDLAASDRGGTFVNSGYQTAYGQFDAWVKAGAFPTVANGRSAEEAIDMFTSGKAAMYLNGNWDITLFHNEQQGKDFQNEIGVIPFPSLHAEGLRSIAGGYTFGIGMSSNLSDAKQAAAFELLRFIYTKEIQSRIVYEALRIPSMKIAFDPARTGPVFAKVIALMEQSRGSFVPYDNLLSPEVKKAFLKGIEELINQSSAPGDALARLEQASKDYWRLRQSSAAQ